VLRALAATASVATCAGVVACGRSGAGPDGAAAAPAGPPPDPCPRSVARTGEIPVGGGRVLPHARVVITQPAEGEFRAFSMVCTHDACELDDVSGGTINCPCHGSRFAIADGSVVQGPARSGLGRERIAVQGDCIVRL
jgi:nitrite reductase/ring-hydroxylating ferredoxin subunit